MSDPPQIAKPEDTCATSKFMVPRGAGFVCRRYPPIANPMRMGGWAQFPITHPEEYCGEWQRA